MDETAAKKAEARYLNPIQTPKGTLISSAIRNITAGETA
jgi:hypothetical protein